MSYQSFRQLEELAAFVSVIDANGFSAAARETAVRKATLSERVQSLEKRLGVPLMVRTTRSIRLTEEGRAYLIHARRCLQSARQADNVAIQARKAPGGHLRITAPNAFVSLLFEEVICAYLSLYPDVTVDINSSSTIRDLARDDFDLAIRVGPLADSSMISRKLANVRAGYFASKTYLDTHGTPQHPGALQEHQSIATQRTRGPQKWPFLINGQLEEVHVSPRITVDSCDTAMASLVGGLGILYAPHRLIEASAHRRTLIPLLAEFSPVAPPVHAVFTNGASKVPKVAAFLELLIAWCNNRDRHI